jgi:ABC-type multidrug transport system fused ATPase/permease subunit
VLQSTVSFITIVFPSLNSLTFIARSRRVDISNKHWHRLNCMHRYALRESLRPDIKVNGLETWLLTQLRQAFSALGDTSTRPFWKNRAIDNTYLIGNVIKNLLHSAEYCWLISTGLSRGVSLGTFELIRSSVDDVVDHVWNISDAAEDAVGEFRNITSFFKCLELKPEIRAPEDAQEYVRNPVGMKVEARGIRFKYKPGDKDEVLRGASFIINPGAMVAIVGYSLKCRTS